MSVTVPPEGRSVVGVKANVMGTEGLPAMRSVEFIANCNCKGDIGAEVQRARADSPATVVGTPLGAVLSRSNAVPPPPPPQHLTLFPIKITQVCICPDATPITPLFRPCTSFGVDSQ